MDATTALDRVIWMAANEPHVLDAAELAVHIAVANHNAGVDKVLCDLTGAKNIFIAITSLVQTTTDCSPVDARLATALHMLRRGWPSPYQKDLADLVASDDSIMLLHPYAPKHNVLRATDAAQVATAPVHNLDVSDRIVFRETFSRLLDALVSNGMSMVAIAQSTKIPYSTLNSWKSGVRAPKRNERPAVIDTLTALKKPIGA